MISKKKYQQYKYPIFNSIISCSYSFIKQPFVNKKYIHEKLFLQSKSEVSNSSSSYFADDNDELNLICKEKPKPNSLFSTCETDKTQSLFENNRSLKEIQEIFCSCISRFSQVGVFPDIVLLAIGKASMATGMIAPSELALTLAKKSLDDINNKNAFPSSFLDPTNIPSIGTDISIKCLNSLNLEDTSDLVFAEDNSNINKNSKNDLILLPESTQNQYLFKTYKKSNTDLEDTGSSNINTVTTNFGPKNNMYCYILRHKRFIYNKLLYKKIWINRKKLYSIIFLKNRVPKKQKNRLIVSNTINTTSNNLYKISNIIRRDKDYKENIQQISQKYDIKDFDYLIKKKKFVQISNHIGYFAYNSSNKNYRIQNEAKTLEESLVLDVSSLQTQNNQIKDRYITINTQQAGSRSNRTSISQKKMSTRSNLDSLAKVKKKKIPSLIENSDSPCLNPINRSNNTDPESKIFIKLTDNILLTQNLEMLPDQKDNIEELESHQITDFRKINIKDNHHNLTINDIEANIDDSSLLSIENKKSGLNYQISNSSDTLHTDTKGKTDVKKPLVNISTPLKNKSELSEVFNSNQFQYHNSDYNNTNKSQGENQKKVTFDSYLKSKKIKVDLEKINSLASKLWKDSSLEQDKIIARSKLYYSSKNITSHVTDEDYLVGTENYSIPVNENTKEKQANYHDHIDTSRLSTWKEINTDSLFEKTIGLMHAVDPAWQELTFGSIRDSVWNMPISEELIYSCRKGIINYFLGVIYQIQEFHDLAIAAFSEVLQDQPYNTSALVQRAISFSATNRILLSADDIELAKQYSAGFVRLDCNKTISNYTADEYRDTRGITLNKC